MRLRAVSLRRAITACSQPDTRGWIRGDNRGMRTAPYLLSVLRARDVRTCRCVVAVCCVWLDIDISGYRSEKRKRTARRFLLLPGRHVIRRRAQVEAAQVPERTGVVEAGAREQALPNRRTKSAISTKGSSISISSKYTQTDGQRIENRKPSVEAKILRRSQVYVASREFY